ncbi:MAG: VWA domain-containing protein [Terriglobales bacterium]
MPHRFLQFNVVLGCCIASLAGAGLAQQAGGGAFTFRASVGEVLVQANVLDRHGRSINDLPQSDFTILENGVRQKIDSFSHDDAPVSVGILVDNSGSMQSKRIKVDQAALNFVRASNLQDEVFIVKFNDEYHLASPFTNSIPQLEQGLGDIDPQAGTAMNDAIIRSVEYLNQKGKHPKKVLLLITDGQDDASSHSLPQTIRMIQSQDAPVIYCIGLLDREDSKAVQRDSQKVLIQIANETGGAAYFPKDLDQVDAITRKVAQDIRLQYSLVYRSNQPPPGYHAITLEVSDPHLKHLKAHTRRGYYRTGDVE